MTPGGGEAIVTCPHPQVRRIIWYSVTVGTAGGISKTCTLEATRPGAPARSAPHPLHASGSITRGLIRPGDPRQARARMAFLPAR